MTAHAASGASRLRLVTWPQDLAVGIMRGMRDAMCGFISQQPEEPSRREKRSATKVKAFTMRMQMGTHQRQGGCESEQGCAVAAEGVQCCRRCCFRVRCRAGMPRGPAGPTVRGSTSSPLRR